MILRAVLVVAVAVLASDLHSMAKDIRRIRQLAECDSNR